MLIGRLLIILFVLVLVLCVTMYLVTHDRRYLNFARQAVRFGVLLAGVFVVLFVLERYVLIGWHVLL